VYACVSSADQCQDLDRQVARVATWATGRNLPVDRVVTEVGPALSGRRDKLLVLLRDLDVTTVVVEHRDRFVRFGAEYVEAVLSASGRRLLVVDPAQVDDDLGRDVTQVLTSLCARLYGRGAAANRVARGVAAIEQDVPRACWRTGSRSTRLLRRCPTWRRAVARPGSGTTGAWPTSKRSSGKPKPPNGYP
jgi:predicted site-specific integrase-resolvase